ncbi:hypothetical protein AtEden1_Chr4g0277871 [Arabidopsis thaliana]
MASSSYCAEKKMERERARKEKERLQSDKVVMAGTLEDSKLRALDKAKQPQNEDNSELVRSLPLCPERVPRSPPRRQGRRTRILRIRSPQSGMLTRKGSIRRPMLALLPALHAPEMRQKRLVKTSRRGKTKREIRKISLFSPPGCLSPTTRSVATHLLCLAVQEFNYAFLSHEDQLFEKDKEIESYKQNEEENARMVDRANSVLSRMRAAKAKVQTLEISNTDLSAKLESGKNAYPTTIENDNRSRAELLACEERMKKLEEGQSVMLHAARQEEKRKVRAQLTDFSSKYGTFYVKSDEVEAANIRAAEVKANRELLEEIEKGEIPSIAEELESVRADEIKFAQKAAEPKTPRPNPVEPTSLLADTPPEVIADSNASDEVLIIDKHGTNKDTAAEAGIAAMFPVDVEKNSDAAE